MWRSIARSAAGDFRGSRLDAMASEIVLDSYPVWVRQAFLFGAVRAAIEEDDVHLARRYLGQIEFAKLDAEQASYYLLFTGLLAEAEGRAQEALDAYGQVIAADIRPTRAEAVYRTLLVLDGEGKLDPVKAAETLSAEALLWRGNALEAGMLRLLSDLYFRSRDYRLGFETVQQAVEFNAETPNTDAMVDEAQTMFADLYLNGTADEIDPIESLTLFYDFRYLTPPGSRGDEMIRNLARRLVDVDLLQQAGDLLQYQIDNRLEGVAEAQIAAELAIIRIAQRDPESALRVLNGTRLADLSPTLERKRRILEAKALIDAGRQELAVDLLSSLTGRDVDLLRIDGLWNGEHYGAAAELIETTYRRRSRRPPQPADADEHHPGRGGLCSRQRQARALAAPQQVRRAHGADAGMGDVRLRDEHDHHRERRVPRDRPRRSAASTSSTRSLRAIARPTAKTPRRARRRTSALGSDETSDQRTRDEVPAVHQDEEDQLERQ